MVTINKQRVADGYLYKIANFRQYEEALAKRGVDRPCAQYSVFVSFDKDELYHKYMGSLDDQIAIFFQLSPATQIDFQVQETSLAAPQGSK